MARWTEDGRKTAIDMIKKGCKIEEISTTVGMSIGSISLLKYKDVLDYGETIRCELCGRSYKQITPKHLK